ncbi:MAG TPA: hypothetical protein VFL93_00710 [Longimicrobiaceae bacterium]|nr:hypothetical protein [Longimicrobiaceae bacterium]
MRWVRPGAPVLCVLSSLLVAGCASAPPGPEARLQISNNHEIAYRGPVEFTASLPDGDYAGEEATGQVRGGRARMVVDLTPGETATLTRRGTAGSRAFTDGPLGVAPRDGRLALAWNNESLGALDLGLVVVPGTKAVTADAVRDFRPLQVAWKESAGGELRGEAERDGYRVDFTVDPYAGGWVDVRARLTRVAPDTASAYVALVRRVTTPGLQGGRQQLNGRVVEGLETPDTWSTDFRYVHGTDWVSWQAGPVSLLALSGFTPVPTVQKPDGSWKEGSHFWVWERSRHEGDGLYFISEVEGPNPHQKTSGYMPVTRYAPLLPGDTVALKWRLAVASAPAASWEESQWRVFAGYRATHAAPTPGSVAARVDLGVPAVAFGTAYFPYSTFNENFDFYRTPGLNQETYWPFSAKMWEDWRAFVPQMRTDLHIIRAMGFERVRMHHLELLQQMDRADALAFLDFYTGEAKALGLKVMIDTEGPPEWVTLLAKRYGDVVDRYELENEIVIGGVHPGDAERWTSLYRAAKAADPTSQAFFTGAGNNGQFERMRALGVPFDRVGLHAYKHGPEWPEAFASHVLGTAGYAADHGQEVTLGEFNWKSLTRLSPEDRAAEVQKIYTQVLRPRAIPELVEFHFQETMSVNPSIARQGIRHYEPLSLDRRPKAAGRVLMRFIREYSAPDAPVRELPVEVTEATLVNGRATVPFRITNRTGHSVSLHLTPAAFDGIQTRLVTPDQLSLASGATAEGRLEVQLPAGAKPGTYHHFLEVDYDGKTSWGWGIAADPGAPRFDTAPVLAGRVSYPQGADVVQRIDWTRPLAVAFGPDAPVLDVEEAYMLANTLQSATGRLVHLSSTADLPDSLRSGSTLLLVGTPETNPLIATGAPDTGSGKGVVLVRDAAGGGQQVLLTGADKKDVEAATTDFVLRYWKNAKDAAIRLVGMEEGAALGHRAGVGETELP